MNPHDRILIVDDHPTNIEILEDLLRDDYHLETARSGEEALALAPTFRPALILLDIMMPGIDGYTTCHELRSIAALRHTKIVMVSAKAMTSDRLKGYEAGADDYITKPFDLNELRAKVRVYLRLKTLEELDQLKSDVLALLSHETATPLNGILGPLQLVQEDPDLDPEERFQLLEMARQSAARLQTLYTKSLTLGAMRGRQVAFEKTLTDLGELVLKAAAAMGPTAAEKDVELALACGETATAHFDAQHIHDVMMALLDNAIRVSSSSSRIDIRVWQEEAYVCVSVCDRGPGITPEFFPHVFEPLAQPDIRHHSRGQGLSLAIAHEVLEAHGGTIGLESEPGKGAIFTLRLPTASL